MTSSTDGTGPNTTANADLSSAQVFGRHVCGARSFHRRSGFGSARRSARAKLLHISPLKAPMDLDYSELDFEYLPNGGWGIDGPTLYATTWETFSPEPNWKKDNVFKTTNGSQAGWHTLVKQVMNQKVTLLRRWQVICRAWRGVLSGRHDVDQLQSLVHPRRDDQIKRAAYVSGRYRLGISSGGSRADTGTGRSSGRGYATQEESSSRTVCRRKVPALKSPCNF